MQKVIYQIDGRDFSTLDQFYDEVSRVLIPGVEWGRNLNAFNDILRGGFGTPKEGFVFRWNNSHLSRERLGYPETVRVLQDQLTRCHPDACEFYLAEIEMAQQGFGPTVFDWLTEILRIHGPEGEEWEDGVDLELA